MLDLRIAPNDSVPIYQQIISQIRYQVASGRLAPGDELPSIRALAERLVVNPNTVARAYRELEAAGIVTVRRAEGTYVSESGAPMDRRERLRILGERVDALLSEARQMDISIDEVVDLMHERDAAMRRTEARERDVRSEDPEGRVRL